MIYSLKKNSWTQTIDYPYGAKQFDQIEMDDIFCGQNAYFCRNAGILGSKLCVTRTHDPVHDCCEGALELWTILQYGVKESWTKVTDSDQMLTGYSDMKGITLSTCWKKIAIDDCGCSTPVWFDTEKELAEFFDIEGAPSHYTAVAYLETPVAVFPPFHS
ncbi:hypothetical protein V6N12_026167 [Hibiscus sabdariffa]|uniref:F-box associated domain-containing protein n=1 Tax=Hibiscus sabdariffa TaxID=183260 RepID=A0ABR2DR07_9ROSI